MRIQNQLKQKQKAQNLGREQMVYYNYVVKKYEMFTWYT